MKVLRRMTSTQEKFRRELIKRDQSCILSNLCHEVCEAAHLVNKEWIESPYKDTKFTRCNGILLNSNIHKEFDLHYWTVDMNEGSWDIIKKNIDIGQTSTYKCDIKLYHIGEKKRSTNMKLEIFNYIDSGIELPIECIPFIIKRNEIYRTINCTEKYSLDDIDKCLKSGLKKKKRMVKKSPSKKTKRTRYTKVQDQTLKAWMNTLERKPDKTRRIQFCAEYGFNENVFEKRFSKIWKNHNEI